MNVSKLLLLVTMLLMGCFVHSESSAAENQSLFSGLQVDTALVEARKVPVLLEVVGTIQAVERAAIAAKVTGVITSVPVVLGSPIIKGDLLVKISAEEINARLKQAEAQLKQAERNLSREQKLFQKKASTSETVRSMEDQYSVAKAGYEEIRTMLGYTDIHAPFDGVVTAKNVHAGDLAIPGTPLLTIENNRRLQVRTAVPESLVLTLTPGDNLRVYIPAVDVSAQGIVAEVAPSADPSSRTAPVTINLPPDERFRSGQFTRVMLPGQEKQSLFVPLSAVVPKGQMDKVFVVDDNKAKLRLVRTGMRYDDMIEILSGLSQGEQVITSNNLLMTNGQAVTPRQ